jgi:hypothetical protein
MNLAALVNCQVAPAAASPVDSSTTPHSSFRAHHLLASSSTNQSAGGDQPVERMESTPRGGTEVKGTSAGRPVEGLWPVKRDSPIAAQVWKKHLSFVPW